MSVPPWLRGPVAGVPAQLQPAAHGLQQALEALRATDPATLDDARAVGRAQLPSTVLGLLQHAAEHAVRHAGQAITTAKLLKAGGELSGS